MRPTFSGFEIAKSGLGAARANLQVTGQNMTNAASKGYTRQRIDTYAVGSYSGMPRYGSIGDTRVGQGVGIGNIVQLRDPFLDAQYRQQHPKAAAADVELGVLGDIEDMFGKATTNDMKQRYSELSSAMKAYAKEPGNKQLEGTVRSSMESIIRMMDTMNTANFDVIRSQLENSLQTGEIDKSNQLLKQIASLNQQIKSANVSGDPALELLDQRNLMLDDLSQYMNIQVSENLIDIGGGRKVPELTVTLLGKSGSRFNLIDNGSYRQMELVKAKSGNMEVNLTEADGSTVSSSDDGKTTLNDGLINQELNSGSIQAALKMLNEKGDFDFNLEDLKKIHLESLQGSGGKLGAIDDMNAQLAELTRTIGMATGNPADPVAAADLAAAMKRLNQYLGKGTVTQDGGRVIFKTDEGYTYPLADANIAPGDPLPYNSFALTKDRDGQYGISLQKTTGTPPNVTVNASADITGKLTSGAINESITILNQREAYDSSISTGKGIGYFEGLLDSFANQFAAQFNALNGAGKPLFESTDGEPINSRNIKISDQWKNATEPYITAKIEPDLPNGIVGDDSENANILRMQEMIDSGKFDFNTTAHTAGLPDAAGNVHTNTLAGSRIDTGTFQDYLLSIASKVSDPIKNVGSEGDVYVGKLDFIQQQRDSMSKVNQDEEGINLIMFNQALTASSRLMTTLDESVDTIINKMGLVGR